MSTAVAAACAAAAAGTNIPAAPPPPREVRFYSQTFGACVDLDLTLGAVGRVAVDELLRGAAQELFLPAEQVELQAVCNYRPASAFKGAQVGSCLGAQAARETLGTERFGGSAWVRFTVTAAGSSLPSHVDALLHGAKDGALGRVPLRCPLEKLSQMRPAAAGAESGGPSGVLIGCVSAGLATLLAGAIGLAYWHYRRRAEAERTELAHRSLKGLKEMYNPAFRSEPSEHPNEPASAREPVDAIPPPGPVKHEGPPDLQGWVLVSADPAAGTGPLTWERLWSARDGAHYWYNSAAGQVRWDTPTCLVDHTAGASTCGERQPGSTTHGIETSGSVRADPNGQAPYDPGSGSDGPKPPHGSSMGDSLAVPPFGPFSDSGPSERSLPPEPGGGAMQDLSASLASLPFGEDGDGYESGPALRRAYRRAAQSQLSGPEPPGPGARSRRPPAEPLAPPSSPTERRILGLSTPPTIRACRRAPSSAGGLVLPPSPIPQFSDPNENGATGSPAPPLC